MNNLKLVLVVWFLAMTMPGFVLSSCHPFQEQPKEADLLSSEHELRSDSLIEWSTYTGPFASQELGLGLLEALDACDEKGKAELAKSISIFVLHAMDANFQQRSVVANLLEEYAAKKDVETRSSIFKRISERVEADWK